MRPRTAAAAGGALEVTLALLVVVAFIAVLAWGARRLRRIGGGRPGSHPGAGERAVGPKERCVLVRVGDTDMLIGVAQGSVRPLHVFPAGANTEAPPAPPSEGTELPNFKDLLMRSLGK